MVLEIIGRAPREAVDDFCKQVRELGLTVEDKSKERFVSLRVWPISNANRLVVLQHLWDLKNGLVPGRQYLHENEIPEEPIWSEPEPMMTA